MDGETEQLGSFAPCVCCLVHSQTNGRRTHGYRIFRTRHRCPRKTWIGSRRMAPSAKVARLPEHRASVMSEERARQVSIIRRWTRPRSKKVPAVCHDSLGIGYSPQGNSIHRFGRSARHCSLFGHRKSRGRPASTLACSPRRTKTRRSRQRSRTVPAVCHGSLGIAYNLQGTGLPRPGKRCYSLDRRRSRDHPADTGTGPRDRTRSPRSPRSPRCYRHPTGEERR